MATLLTTIKTTPDALKMLRLTAALTGEKQFQILERLLTAELSRIQVPEAIRHVVEKGGAKKK